MTRSTAHRPELCRNHSIFAARTRRNFLSFSASRSRAHRGSGLPDGHPKIAEAALGTALAEKRALARGARLDLQVVTQFCFESEPILAWAAKMKGHGLPMRVGLAGPASLPRLLRFAALCGIGNSVRALKARPRAITRLLVEAGPEAVVRDIVRPGGAAIAGVHFFCFGGLLRIARWLRAVREGRFELTPTAVFGSGPLKSCGDHLQHKAH